MSETIELKLYGFDDSGADGVPPNPWWAKAQYYLEDSHVVVTSTRRRTAWLAIADVIHAMNPHRSDEPYAATRAFTPRRPRPSSERAQVAHSEALLIEVMRLVETRPGTVGTLDCHWVARIFASELVVWDYGVPKTVRLYWSGKPRATAWEAIASSLEARARAEVAVNDTFKAKRDGECSQDGRYIPSPKVDYSKHGGNGEMRKKETTPEEALLNDLRSLIGPDEEGLSGHVLRGRIAQAVDRYRFAVKHVELDLPWRRQSLGHDQAEPGREYQVISASGALIGNELTEAQARAILFMASVYDRANGLLAFYRGEDGRVSDGNSEGDCEQAMCLEGELIKAGWIE